MRREYDAVFIHGQGYRNRPGLEPIPAIRGRLEISAIRELLRRGTPINHFVFSGFAFPGQTIPLAEVDADDLVRRAKVNSSHIIADKTARTTGMEVDYSARVAKEKGWTNVLHLTYDGHRREVARDAKRKFDKNIKVEVITAEEILTKGLDRHSTRYRRFIQAYNRSAVELRLRGYELTKYLIKLFPFGEELLNKISIRYRPDVSY